MRAGQRFMNKRCYIKIELIEYLGDDRWKVKHTHSGKMSWLTGKQIYEGFAPMMEFQMGSGEIYKTREEK